MNANYRDGKQFAQRQFMDKTINLELRSIYQNKSTNMRKFFVKSNTKYRINLIYFDMVKASWSIQRMKKTFFSVFLVDFISTPKFRLITHQNKNYHDNLLKMVFIVTIFWYVPLYAVPYKVSCRLILFSLPFHASIRKINTKFVMRSQQSKIDATDICT